MMMEAAMEAPEVRSWRSTSQAPAPSTAICTARRQNFVTATSMAARSAARCCGSAICATCSRQRAITAGSMPMLSITSAFRAMPSARRWAAMPARLAARSSRAVESSESRVRPNSTSAPPSAIQPISGCSRKMTPI